MPTVCESCGRHNRTQAMFCSGCLKKLPAFVASGPSALETFPSKPAASSVSADSTHVFRRSISKPNFQLGLPLLLIALCTVFVGWVATMPRTGKATLQVAAAGDADSPVASAPVFIPHSSPSVEPGADRMSLQPDEGGSARRPPAMRAMDEPASSHSDLSALNTVVVFYHALSVGDGRAAAAAVTPAKRGVIAFREDRITSFYSSLREPLVVESIQPMALNRFEVRYSYRVSRARCSARATVETEIIGQKTYIRSIQAQC